MENESVGVGDPAITLAISYSHSDRRFRAGLDRHLASLRREGLVAIWHDRMILAGEEWAASIDNVFDTVDVIVLLLSADFIASDYCYSVEMAKALARHRAGTAAVLPVIVRPVDWIRSPLAGIQVLPVDGKPIAEWRHRDRAWVEVVNGIRAVLTNISQRSFHRPVVGFDAAETVARYPSAHDGVTASKEPDRKNLSNTRHDGPLRASDAPSSSPASNDEASADRRAEIDEGPPAVDQGNAPEGAAALDGLIGLSAVKNLIERRLNTIRADQALRAEGLGRGASKPSLHMVFTGNPGTGKTMVARLVGQMYRELGLLNRGHLIEADPNDLVSGYVGGTAERTASVIQSALDGVLFIDEAYRLTDQRHGFGAEAVDLLLSEMENYRDRLVVIVAGYPDRMKDFLDSNPGLPSRFPTRNRIEFPNYPPDELLAILLRVLQEDHGLSCSDDLKTALATITEALYQRADEKFGNARTMRELAADIKDHWATRTRPVVGTALTSATVDDIPDEFRRLLDPHTSLRDVLAELDQLVGLGGVKETVRRMAAVLELRRHQPDRRSRAVAPHLLFIGSPGTGKTTVANLLGRVFLSLGLLTSGHVVTVTRADLIAGYVGQTAIKTREKVMEATDGILLIDEAYDLSRGDGSDFGFEAITELIVLMESMRGRLVVIAAGYPEPMERFLNENDGLSSRFTERIQFPNYDEAELRLIFESLAASEGYRLAEGVSFKALRWLDHRRKLQGHRFGNARAVRDLLGRCEQNLALRLQSLSGDVENAAFTEIVDTDVPDPKDQE